MMNGHGKSDGSIVSEKSPNKPRGAEGMERRRPAKGNGRQSPILRTQSREKRMKETLERIREAVRRDRKAKLTALYHHVYDIDHLREAYYGLKRNAAAGVDGETWHHYGQNLEENLRDLSERLGRRAYRVTPVRRVYIPKGDGRQRPLGIPALEDKIVQSVTAQMLSVIWEEEFLGFSYGFRPERSPHQGLDALTVGMERGRVRWVLDADIEKYYDSLSHEWLRRFIEHRIGDRRILALIEKWLRAGVLEDGMWTRSEEGTPQGGLISPVLANIYLHYVFDVWAHHWRKQHARGEVIMVRYADDFVVGFEHREEAERFQEALKERMSKFDLRLQGDKTRLIEFGRFAATNREKRGERKPETFNFLGFIHSCGKTRKGRFCVLRQTVQKRMRAKLKAVKTELQRQMHEPVPEQGKWLRVILLGHYRYYGVPRNSPALGAFRQEVVMLWRRILRKRGQRSKITWERMNRWVNRWLPYPHICHPYPAIRPGVTT
jgi:RNA-directed DNA polymerase